MKHNSFFDPTPTQLYKGTTLEKLMNLRPRDKDKELGHESFRYHPKTNVERVYDTLINRNTSYIPQNEIVNKSTMLKLKQLNKKNVGSKESIEVKPSEICSSLH